MKSKYLKDLPIIINGFISGQLVMLAGITWTTGILWFLLMISFFWYGKIEYDEGKNNK